jgi:hypothetical protein
MEIKIKLVKHRLLQKYLLKQDNIISTKSIEVIPTRVSPISVACAAAKHISAN